MIHAAKILNTNGSYCDTKPGQVFRLLDEDLAPEEEGFYASEWYDGWKLTLELKTTAIGTRMSEIRAQLPGGELYESLSPELQRRLRGYELPPADNRGDGFWYRLVWHPGERVQQMAFGEAHNG